MTDEIILPLNMLAIGKTGWGDDLLFATWLTLQLAFWSMAVGLLLGLALAGAKLSRVRLLMWLAEIYTMGIRGIPEFLILLIVFFGSGKLINSVLSSLGIDMSIEVPKLGAAVAGLALIFAAYACEIFRGAFQSVPNGQIEAGKAIGLDSLHILLKIQFPQMWRFAIPGLGNLWMVVLKDTSLAAVIALNELLRVSKIAGETESQQLLFFTVAGSIYLALTLTSDIGRAWLERWARRGVGSV